MENMEVIMKCDPYYQRLLQIALLTGGCRLVLLLQCFLMLFFLNGAILFTRHQSRSVFEEFLCIYFYVSVSSVF